MQHVINEALDSTGRQAAMANQGDPSISGSRRSILAAGALALAAAILPGRVDVVAGRSSQSASAQTPAGTAPTTTVSTTAHLNFQGDARAALEFYQSVVGGELLIITNQDMGIVDNPDEADQVKWGQVAAPNGFKVMAYDVPSAQPFDRGTTSFFLSLRGQSTDEIAALWERLVVGSTVIVPLAPAQWAPLYGMLTDPYGITWVVDVVNQYPPT